MVRDLPTIDKRLWAFEAPLDQESIRFYILGLYAATNVVRGHQWLKRPNVYLQDAHELDTPLEALRAGKSGLCWQALDHDLLGWDPDTGKPTADFFTEAECARYEQALIARGVYGKKLQRELVLAKEQITGAGDA